MQQACKGKRKYEAFLGPEMFRSVISLQAHSPSVFLGWAPMMPHIQLLQHHMRRKPYEYQFVGAVGD